jgi:hypothetical protein
MFKNITIIKDKTEKIINGKRCCFQPWMLENEEVNFDGHDYVFGHFEVYGCNLSMTNIDLHSKLTPDSFLTNTRVFSGHYHLHHSKQNILYIGTPYQMSWSDFGNNCGFYVLNEDFSVEHISNAVSSIYIKISVWGENEESTHIEINNGSNNMLVSLDYLSEWVKDKNIIVKLFCENGLDSTFEGAKSILESNNVKYTAIDNRMIKLLEKQECVNVQDTRETLLQYVDTVAPDLKQLLLDLLNSNNE